MELKESKCVMVIDEELPLGLIANTAAVLALTLGQKIEGIIGPDVYDGTGYLHTGITTIPIPMLKGTREKIREMREKLYTEEFSDLLVVDVTNAAQTTTTYEDYTEKISLYGDDLQYVGLAIYGKPKKVNKLSGSLPLLR
ncbi:DUF2000 domain-containing protein [Fodinisporobacter ferrooxydans]|uniref:DUF2000 domain-containing protein n=1 Tax=Fodinisporobacter ferrooxydans TaxID=2901836 RepID=A0ABY4CL49_9BACL|nr:DUF2000 domain-containing protein [Alicyclobacillaceae bacterium MYW30-H2]